MRETHADIRKDGKSIFVEVDRWSATGWKQGEEKGKDDDISGRVVILG